MPYSFCSIAPRRRFRTALPLLLIPFSLHAITEQTGKSNPPVRLAIKMEHASVRVNTPWEITVELRDAYNNVATAPKTYVVHFEVTSAQAKGAKPVRSE